MVKKSLFWFYKSLVWGIWVSSAIVILTILGFRYILLPNISQYKPRIEAEISQLLGQKLTIKNIAAGWDGMNPHLSLSDTTLYDTQGRPALSLSHVETSLSWMSLALLEPRLASLVIHSPTLVVRREPNGEIFVAGISTSGPSKPEATNWVLHQSRVEITDANIVWQDALKHAPDLRLEHAHLVLRNPMFGQLIGRHQFAFNAIPSVGTPKPLDIRATFYGNDIRKLSEWHGTLFGQFEDLDLAAWHPWIHYPIQINRGFGALRFWLKFDHSQAKELTSDVALADVKTHFTPQTSEVGLDHIQGRLHWIHSHNSHQFSAERIHIKTKDGLHLENGLIVVKQSQTGQRSKVEGAIKFSQFDLAQAHQFAKFLPIPSAVQSKLDALSPRGRVSDIDVEWNTENDKLISYEMAGKFQEIGVNAFETYPGITGLSGEIRANNHTGHLNLSTQNAVFDMPSLMRWPIPVQHLRGSLHWTYDHDAIELVLDEIKIANQELNGQVSGKLALNTPNGDYIDIKGSFPFANAQTANHYYPKIMGKDTLEWLDKSIQGGTLSNIELTMRGKLKDFPYTDRNLGLFKVTADLKKGILEYGEGWPRIDNLALKMTFQGPGLTLEANGGTISGTQIQRAKGVIPVLDAEDPILTITSEGRGQIKDGIAFINHSPVLEITDGFTNDLVTTGNGILQLGLVIPLNDTDRTNVKGRYQIINGSMASEAIPDLTKINGTLEFTEHALSSNDLNAWVFGGPAQLNLSTGKNRLIMISASGRVTDAGLKEGLQLSLLNPLSGHADWNGDIVIQQQKLDIDIRTNLLGMASDWPEPLKKTALEPMPFRYTTHQERREQDTMSISIGEAIHAKFLRQRKQDQLAIERGIVAVNAPTDIPAQSGLLVQVNRDTLAGNDWLSALKTNTGASQPGGDAIVIRQVNLNVNDLEMYKRHIHQANVQATPNENGWNMQIQSQEIVGNASWYNAGKGKIVARLKSLAIPPSQPNNGVSTEEKQAIEYPDLDIMAEQFETSKKKLGAIELKAQERNDSWVIEKLQITNPDSLLKADGEWKSWKKTPNTRMNVDWTITDLGKTMERFGHPNTIQGAKATLQGQLSWPNSPHEFEAAKLNGNIKLEALNGQILKVQPGVGRLFSMLTLQNLPRRLTFDFRDVFSDGFTFDKISANVHIERGILRSDNFKLKGPTAAVDIKGETDLSKETQHLFVKVTPYVSDSVSLAALAGGPAVAAAAYLAQKLLKDPLNQLARNEYEIMGTWDNPIEVKQDEKQVNKVEPAIKTQN